MAPKKKPAVRQQSLEATGHLPLLAKPIELVGKQVSVPGSFWGTAARRGEANQIYICIINDFTLLHTFSATDKGPAFQLIECGVTGSEGNSEPFWMQYPFPFLEFWYKDNPISRLF